MGDVIYQGGMQALVDGDLAAPDLRLLLVAENFTGVDTGTEQDAVNIDDFATLDEFGGAGYQQLDCQNVTVTYDATAHEFVIDFDNGEFNASGGTVAPGPRDYIGILVKLYVDGTDPNDIAVGFTDAGGFPGNGVNTVLALSLTDGFLTLAPAP